MGNVAPNKMWRPILLIAESVWAGRHIIFWLQGAEKRHQVGVFGPPPLDGMFVGDIALC